MKILVFLLVLANLLFYSFSNGYLGKPERPDAERVERQVHPERMRIVSRGEEPPLQASSARHEVGAPPAAAVVPEVAMVDSAARVCLFWEHLPATEADRLVSVLGTHVPVFAVKRTDGGESGGWWIFIPPPASKVEADKKAAELRQLGVSDYFIVQEGPNRLAISLGIFSSEKGGQDRLAELKAKGVRSARLMPRPGKNGTVSLQAVGPLSERDALFGALNGSLAKPAVRDCP